MHRLKRKYDYKIAYARCGEKAHSLPVGEFERPLAK
jgi:hypothetical protein